MNKDLIRFYNTVHKIYMNLAAQDSVNVDAIYKTEEHHPDQFNVLIKLLDSIKLISVPANQEYPNFTTIKRGAEFTKFRTWSPSDSKTLSNNLFRYEYYILYVEFGKNKRSINFSNLKHNPNLFIDYLIPGLILNSEIFKYCTEISRGTVGNSLLQISSSIYLPNLIPDRIAIFDLSKQESYEEVQTLEGFQELLGAAQNLHGELSFDTLRSIGNEVTSELGYSLDDIRQPSFETYFRLKNLYPDFESNLEKKLRTTQKEKPAAASTKDEKEKKITISNERNQTHFRFGSNYAGIIDNQVPACFDIERISSVFADHIKSLNEESGQMIGIFGRWGRGKTYFVKKLCEHLGIDFKNETGNGPFHFIRFQAWKYQDTPAIWAYLYEEISKKYLGKNEFVKVWRCIKLNIRRERWGILKDLITTGLLWGLIVFVLNLFKTSGTGFIGDLINLFKNNGIEIISGGTIITLLVQFYHKEGHDAREILKEYAKEISFFKYLGIQAEIEKELVNLLKTWIKINKNTKEATEKRLLLFVDDIDRCSEEKIMQLIDALRVMLEHPDIIKRVIVLVAIDEEKLKMAIRSKYQQMTSEENSPINMKRLENEYLDKLFISGMKLQTLNAVQRDEYISSLVNETWQNKPFNNEPKIKEISGTTRGKSDITRGKEDIQTNLTPPSPSTVPGKPTGKPKTKEFHVFELAELSAKEEINLLQEELKLFKNELTPRQIRVFYYRFLLAKNLYIKLIEAEDSKIITTDLPSMLEVIRKRTEDENKNEPNSKADLIDQIAEMVVGY